MWAFQQAIAAEGKSPACEDPAASSGRCVGGFGQIGHKKQGRRRSITPNGLASPDIEIGSRRPVNYTLTRNSTVRCDPFHNWQKSFGWHFPRRDDRAATGTMVFRKRAFLAVSPAI
jgi:hypothetical protein